MAKIVAIDLFCGIGGLTHGLFNAGIDVRAGFDIDKTCMKSFSQKKNGRPIFINADIKTLKEEVFQNFFSDLSTGDYKMIAGCAPCQPYSAHQKNKDTISRSLHKSYGLILEYLRVVRSVNPHFVVMENVKELMKDPIFIDVFLKYFIDNNYFVDYKVVDMAKYGAPQRRKRLLFVAISKTIKNFNEFEIKESYGDGMKKTVFDAISGLPTIAAGETDLFDPLHRSSKLSDLNLKRIESSTEGGTWKEWPKNLLPECYLKNTGATYTSVYGRVSRNDVAPTLTTQFNRYGTGRYGHYEQNRALSLREGAILQTFPSDYLFDLNLGTNVLARQIGNAVPPIYAEKLGHMIFDLIS